MKLRTLLFTLLIGISVFPSASFAQAPKPVGGTQNPPPPPPPPANPSTIINRDWEKLQNQGRSGDLLTGTVTVAGAGLPWEQIPIQISCDDKIQYTTAADSKGFFSISPVDTKGSTTIAADPKPVASRYVGCVVTASLPGFNSSSIPIGARHVMDSPNLGTITLSREAGGAGLSSTSVAAPKYAVKAFEKARGEFVENKLDRAQKDLQKAVEIYPQYAEAWYQLGRIQEAANSPEAGNSFSQATAADPKFFLPYEHLATLAGAQQKWPEVITQTEHALAIDPRGSIDIFYYNALGNFQSGNLHPAEVSAKKALSMDPLHRQPLTEQLLAVILSQQGDTAGALVHLRNCATYFAPGPNLDLVKQQIAELDPSSKSK